MTTGKGASGKSRSFPQRALHHVLALVRGPLFLSAISLGLLCVIPAAQATLLKGYIQADEGAPPSSIQNPEEAKDSVPGLVSAQGSDQGTADSQPKALTVYGQQDSVSSPAEASMHRRVAELRSAIATNSFPISFAGAWKCVSVVTGSAVATVPVGQRLESSVKFTPSADGRIVARWQQPGWTNAQERITPMSENEAALDRTNYFSDNMNAEWAARSHDHYLKVDANRMIAQSRIEQFVGGQFMGRYETRSTLYRLDDNMALAR